MDLDVLEKPVLPNPRHSCQAAAEDKLTVLVRVREITLPQL